MTRNYELVYYVAQNVGIIGILAYPKSTIYQCANRSNTIAKLRNCYYLINALNGLQYIFFYHSR